MRKYAITEIEDGFLRPEPKRLAGVFRFWNPFRRHKPPITEVECRNVVYTTARHLRRRLALDRGELDDKAARVWRFAQGKGREAVVTAVVAELQSTEHGEGI